MNSQDPPRDRPHGQSRRGGERRPTGEPPRPSRPGGPAAGGPIPIRRALSSSPGAEAGTAPVEGGRSFEADGETWIARPEGESAIGHGAGARAYLVALRFYRAGDDVAACEVLVPRGRLEALYDEELAELLHRATPLEPPPEPDHEPPPGPRPDERRGEAPSEG